MSDKKFNPDDTGLDWDVTEYSDDVLTLCMSTKIKTKLYKWISILVVILFLPFMLVLFLQIIQVTVFKSFFYVLFPAVIICAAIFKYVVRLDAGISLQKLSVDSKTKVVSLYKNGETSSWYFSDIIVAFSSSGMDEYNVFAEIKGIKLALKSGDGIPLMFPVWQSDNFLTTTSISSSMEHLDAMVLEINNRLGI